MLPAMEEAVSMCDDGISSTHQLYQHKHHQQQQQEQQQVEHASYTDWRTSSSQPQQQVSTRRRCRRSAALASYRPATHHVITAPASTTTASLSTDEEMLTKPQTMSYVDHVTQWLNEQTCDGTVKRRRKVSRRQRVAANDRERRRMRQLNAAFDRLREQIPAAVQTSAGGERSHRPLSRIQTLRLAIDYIAFMMHTLDNTQRDELSGQYSEEQWQQVSLSTESNNYAEDEMKPGLLEQYEVADFAQQPFVDFITIAPSSTAVFDNSSVASNISYTSLQPL